MEPELRRAARLLVVNARNDVFLFHYEDDGRWWWAIPGGGLDEGETSEDAAAREALECVMALFAREEARPNGHPDRSGELSFPVN